MRAATGHIPHGSDVNIPILRKASRVLFGGLPNVRGVQSQFAVLANRRVDDHRVDFLAGHTTIPFD
jgi:hypothetical protein